MLACFQLADQELYHRIDDRTSKEPCVPSSGKTEFDSSPHATGMHGFFVVGVQDIGEVNVQDACFLVVASEARASWLSLMTPHFFFHRYPSVSTRSRSHGEHVTNGLG